MNLHVAYKHNHSQKEAREAVEKAITSVPGFDIALSWESETSAKIAVAKGRRTVSGTLFISDESIDIEIDLPPFVAAFAGVIRGEIVSQLHSALPGGEDV